MPGVTSVIKNANIGDAANLIFGAVDYKNAREQGDNVPVSVAKAAGTFVWGEMYYGAQGLIVKDLAENVLKLGPKGAGALNVAAMVGMVAFQAGGEFYKATSQHTTQTMSEAYNHRGKLGSGHFDMTNAGYTMRQRSLNAIRQNGLNTSSVLGNEARTYFRSTYER